jgi:tRNA threonylcarbamoyladenosine biosynthesis protein TsaB
MEFDMNMLGFDTSTPILSVGLRSGGAFYQMEAEGQRHSELIMDLADSLLQKSGIEKSSLSHVACMRGPGSFTGLRIGFAAAKGIGTALGIPLLSVPTLDCMALPYSFWPGLVLPLMDAKKKAWFTALYRGGEKISEYLDLTPGEIASLLALQDSSLPVLLSGLDAEKAFPELSALLPQFRFFIAPKGGGKVRELLALAEKVSILDNGEENSGPLYLRKSDAELNG